MRFGQKQAPFGILWMPQMVACAFDTITFSGIEHENHKFVHQTWYCQTRSAMDNG